MILDYINPDPPLNILGAVDCGSHHATTCANCPFKIETTEDPSLCGGDCIWDYYNDYYNGDCIYYG